MNTWENSVITSKGLALQSKLTQGHTLRITKAVTGAGYVSPGLLLQQTAVQSIKQTLKAKPASYPEEGKCTLPLVLTNDGLATGYTATQIGIYAEDPDEGEILYFISQAVSGKGTEVPSETEMPGYNAEWNFYFQYGQADGVNVTVDPANTINVAQAQALIEEALKPLAAEVEETQKAAAAAMKKNVYDTDGNGVVDNAEKLGGQLPSYYASKEALQNAQANTMPKTDGHAEMPTLSWTLSDGGKVELKRSGAEGSYDISLIHTAANGTKTSHTLISSNANGYEFQLATKDEVTIDKKSNLTNFNDYTYECMEFVNLSNITGEKPVSSGIALFICKKGDISTSFSGYIQLLVTRDGRVFGRQIYGRNGAISNYGAWVDFYSKEINKLYETTLNADDLIEDLNDCVLGHLCEYNDTMANTPTSGSGVVTTFGNSSKKYQIAYTEESTPGVYMRTNFGSGWSAWGQVITTANFKFNSSTGTLDITL